MTTIRLTYEQLAGRTGRTGRSPEAARMWARNPAAMNCRDDLLFTLCMALRTVPRGILRDLGKPRLPPDKLAEKVLAQPILKHLELCGLPSRFEAG